ncbi:MULTISPECIES: cytochrome c3 family protein [Thiorhodovibrio]|uniref:cytochrome c3 family protein n=1 Tax=Thiorhodovibrio TaxID=61593 RepID=UPI001911E4B8|nr:MULTISPECIES: cytochrome c3 family protein [Thiorhodovibrio]WPL14214.1 Intracellular sulfur oxidation protein DsrL [Thiorhodovibrio litoralis]
MTEAKVTNSKSRKSIWRTGWIASCVGVFLLGLAGIGVAHAEPLGGFVVPGSRAAKLDSCVEPTRAMRRYHMKYIRHQRDTTVYDGIRHTKYSLSGCVDCHAAHDAKGVPVPVSNHGQFCNACHETAAVTLNCFDCHATVPDGESWNQVTEEVRANPHQVRHPHPMSAGAPVTPKPAGVQLGSAALAQVPAAQAPVARLPLAQVPFAQIPRAQLPGVAPHQQVPALTRQEESQQR